MKFSLSRCLRCPRKCKFYESQYYDENTVHNNNFEHNQMEDNQKDNGENEKKCPNVWQHYYKVVI